MSRRLVGDIRASKLFFGAGDVYQHFGNMSLGGGTQGQASYTPNTLGGGTQGSTAYPQNTQSMYPQIHQSIQGASQPSYGNTGNTQQQWPQH